MGSQNFLMEYSDLEDFLIKELDKFDHGKLKPWCEKHDLSASEISRFRNRNLPTTRPFFMQDILKALGYTEVKVETKVYFRFKKKIR